MHEFLADWPLLSVFLAASVVLAVSPGPGVLYIVTRSIVHGRQQGLLSVLGVALGNFGNACLASLGLAALFAVSAAAFTVVKYVGALYLIYLGSQMLLQSASTDAAAPAALPRRVFLDGFMVALFNPKTTIFYAAFLPQFLEPGASAMMQSMLLGAIFVVIAAASDCVYALAASAVAPLRTSSFAGTGRRLGGGLFIGLGILAALMGPRSGR